MIKVSVMYPYAAGARFDHAYYRDKHMPMVKQRLGAACLYYTVDKGIAGGAPALILSRSQVRLRLHFYRSFQAARDPCAGDHGRHRQLHGYTAWLQISEVVVERSEV